MTGVKKTPTRPRPSPRPRPKTKRGGGVPCTQDLADELIAAANEVRAELRDDLYVKTHEDWIKLQQGQKLREYNAYHDTCRSGSFSPTMR